MPVSNRNQSRIQSKKMAFCGMLVALSIVTMLLGGLIPIATYCVPMFCGVLLLPILIEYGKVTAWTAFAAVALIALLLGIDKEAAFFYLFLGHYPLLKLEIDRIKNKPIRVGAKLVFFNLATFLMYAILGFILHMDAVVEEFKLMGPWLLVGFVLLFDFCFFLYDRLLYPLSFLYIQRIHPKLKFIK